MHNIWLRLLNQIAEWYSRRSIILCMVCCKIFKKNYPIGNPIIFLSVSRLNPSIFMKLFPFIKQWYCNNKKNMNFWPQLWFRFACIFFWATSQSVDSFGCTCFSVLQITSFVLWSTLSLIRKTQPPLIQNFFHFATMICSIMNHQKIIKSTSKKTRWRSAKM